MSKFPWHFVKFPDNSLTLRNFISPWHFPDGYEPWSAKWWPFCPGGDELTHWDWVTHICIRKLTFIGSDNGLSAGQCQAIIWSNAGILLIGPLGTNFSEISIEIHPFSFKKMHLKMSSAKWGPFCLGLILNKISLVFVAKVPMHNMSSTGASNGLALTRHHIITWVNVDQDMWCHIAHPGRNWVKRVSIMGPFKHIEAETKWPPFRRRHFQSHFREWKC